MRVFTQRGVPNLEIVFGIVAGLIALAFFVWLFIYVPATMASNRDRSPILWVIVSLLITPLLSILLLWILGDK
jgi:lipopolysaccharide export LptBFGC system permease protein LptF